MIASSVLAGAAGDDTPAASGDPAPGDAGPAGAGLGGGEDPGAGDTAFLFAGVLMTGNWLAGKTERDVE